MSTRFSVEFYVNLAVEIPIAIFAVGGNALVCWAVYRNKHLRCVTNYFIVSLAVADLCVGLFAIPFSWVTSIGLPGDFYACLLLNSFIIIMTQSSIFSLLAIAMDRFFAITAPLKYRRLLSNRRCVAIIVATWFFAFFIGLIPVMGWNLGPPPEPRCYFIEVIDMEYMVYFNFFACVLTPLLIMIVIYVRIFRTVRQQLRKMKEMYASQPDAAAKHLAAFTLKEVKTAKSLAVIMILFAISWLPLHVLNTIDLICEDCAVPYPLLLSTIMLSHANSAMNPIFYAFSNKEFKYTFGKLLGRLVKFDVFDDRNKRQDPNAVDTDFSVSFVMQDLKSTFPTAGQRALHGATNQQRANGPVVMDPCLVTELDYEETMFPPGTPATPTGDTTMTRLDSAGIEGRVDTST